MIRLLKSLLCNLSLWFSVHWASHLPISLLPRSASEGPCSVTNEAVSNCLVTVWSGPRLQCVLNQDFEVTSELDYLQTSPYRTSLFFWKLKSPIYLQAMDSADGCNMSVLMKTVPITLTLTSGWRCISVRALTSLSGINKHSCVHFVLRSDDEPACPL